MAPYLLLGVFLWVSGILSHNKKFYGLVYIFLLVVVSLFAALRGDFATDYNNYKWLYDATANLGFHSFVSGSVAKEPGFSLFIIIFDMLFGSFEVFMGAVHFAIVFLLGYVFYRLTSYSWLLLFLFVTIGPFYASFNITRQIIAASLLFFFYFIAHQSYSRFLLGVLFASFFHLSSVFLAPLYLFRLPFLLALFGLTLFLIIFFIFRDPIIAAGLIIYGSYELNEDALSFGNAVLGIAAFLVSLFLYLSGWVRRRDLLNASLLFFVFSLLSLEYGLLNRFSYFFATFFCFLLVVMVEKNPSASQRLFLCMLIGIFGVLYNYMTLRGSGYDPYYTIFG